VLKAPADRFSIDDHQPLTLALETEGPALQADLKGVGRKMGKQAAESAMAGDARGQFEERS
jgi:hypothetical protein